MASTEAVLDLADSNRDLADSNRDLADAYRAGLPNTSPDQKERSRSPGITAKVAARLIIVAAAVLGFTKAGELNPEPAQLVKDARTKNSPALTLEASNPTDFSENNQLSDAVIDAAQVTPIGCVPAKRGETDDTICLVLDTWNAQEKPRVIASLASGAGIKAAKRAIESELVGGCENLRDSAVENLDDVVTSNIDPSSIGLWPADGRTRKPTTERMC